MNYRIALQELGIRQLNLASAAEPITAEKDPYKIIQVHDYKSISFLRQNPNVKAASTEVIKQFALAYPELLKVSSSCLLSLSLFPTRRHGQPYQTPRDSFSHVGLVPQSARSARLGATRSSHHFKVTCYVPVLFPPGANLLPLSPATRSPARAFSFGAGFFFCVIMM